MASLVLWLEAGLHSQILARRWEEEASRAGPFGRKVRGSSGYIRAELEGGWSLWVERLGGEEVSSQQRNQIENGKYSCPHPTLALGPRESNLTSRLRFIGCFHVNGLCGQLPRLSEEPSPPLHGRILCWTQACLERLRQAPGLQNPFPVNAVNSVTPY